MLNLYESILKSTGAGAFKFTNDMLVRVNGNKYPDDFKTQFDIDKMVRDFGKAPVEQTPQRIIWNALVHIKTSKTEKETRKALIHSFIWDGPEDKYFKDVFKGYLIDPENFDFFCYTEDKEDELYIATHDKKGGKGGSTRHLFTIKMK